MNRIKEDSTLIKIGENQYIINQNSWYIIQDNGQNEFKNIEIIEKDTKEKIIISKNNLGEFIETIMEKTTDFTREKLEIMHDVISNYQNKMNQYIKELIDALSFNKSLAVEVIKEDNNDFGRLVRTASEYHLANQMNYTKAMKETKNIFKTIKLADFVVSSGDKVNLRSNYEVVN